MSNPIGKAYNNLWVSKAGYAGVYPTQQQNIRLGAVGIWDKSTGFFQVIDHLDDTWGITLPPTVVTNEIPNLSFSSEVTDKQYFTVSGDGKATEVETLPTTGNVDAEIRYKYEDDNSSSVVCSNLVVQSWANTKSFMEQIWNDALYLYQNRYVGKSPFFDTWEYRIVYEVVTANDFVLTASPNASSKFKLTGTAGELSALEGGKVTGAISTSSTSNDTLNISGYQNEPPQIVGVSLGAFETWTIKGQKNHMFLPNMNAQ